MKILNVPQIRELEACTMREEPISSVGLMNRAGSRIYEWIIDQYRDVSQDFLILCGKGNNGGDGLVVGRLLHLRGYTVRIAYMRSDAYTDEFRTQLGQVKKLDGIELSTIESPSDIPRIDGSTIVIDALLGLGVSGKLKGPVVDIVNHINQKDCRVIAIDLPSGLSADEATLGTAMQADITLTLGSVKMALLMPENFKAVGEFVFLPIGFHEACRRRLDGEAILLTRDRIQGLLKKRKKYDHKGIYGHALMIHGSYGKMGAAVLAARACLRSGIGLLTTHLPKAGYEIMQVSIPEAMVSVDHHERIFTEAVAPEQYDVISLGCGLGQNALTQQAVQVLLTSTSTPMVIDADGLNIIAANQELLDHIPEQSILSPHVKEFTRLFGKSDNDFERLELQKAKSVKYSIFILLKGAHSILTTPEGRIYINNTGNPGMATGGSGDVLTGILTGLVGRGYSPQEASQIAMYIHGLAGDLAATQNGYESLSAGDIVSHLSEAFLDLESQEEQ